MARWWNVLAVAALVGCADPVDSLVPVDTSNPSDTSDPEDTGDVGNQGTCVGNPFTLHINGLVVAAEDQGFDLDGHETLVDTNPVGCGKVDVAGGIDNALTGVDAALAGFDLAIGPSLTQSVQDGQLVIILTVSGYDGGPEDDCVSVDISVNAQPAASAVQGTISGGALELSVDSLPPNGQFDMGIGPMDVDITLRTVQLWLPLVGDPFTVTGGLLGGGMPWDEATSDSDLRALVQANIQPNFFGLVEAIMLAQMDLQPPSAGDTATCDALSTALVVTASSN